MFGNLFSRAGWIATIRSRVQPVASGTSPFFRVYFAPEIVQLGMQFTSAIEVLPGAQSSTPYANSLGVWAKWPYLYE